MHSSARSIRPTTRRPLLLPLLLILATAFCGGDDPAPMEPDPEVATIEVTPATSTLQAVGATVQLSAVARDDQGATVSGVSFSWTSNASGVASVSGTGLVTAVGDGNATISASADGVSGSASVTVAQQITQVAVTPAEASVEVGGMTTFAAEAQDANGNAVDGASFTWASDTEAVATVDADGQATGVSSGEATITAESEGFSGTALLTVTAPVASVDVTPDSTRLTAVDATVQLSATVVDTEGDTLANPALAWSSSDAAVATVDGSGLVTARGAGTARVAGASGSVADTATVVVDPQVVNLEITPAADTVEVGGSTTFTAGALDSNDNAVGGVGFTWTSNDTTVATVDDMGRATGQAEGTAQITATAGMRSASATLTVTAPAQAPTMARVSGNGQFGTTQQAYGSALVVEVTDGGGAPVSGVSVGWAVTQGAGTISASSTTTDAQGRASVTVTAGAATGDLVVAATSAEADGGPVTFDLRTSVMAVQVVDNAFVDVDGRRNANFEANIQVGDTILFTYVPAGAVTHTVTSSDTPAGGASFDSGSMNPGDTFRFAPQVVGTWTFFCAVHPATMLDATIVVTDPGAVREGAEAP